MIIITWCLTLRTIATQLERNNVHTLFRLFCYENAEMNVIHVWWKLNSHICSYVLWTMLTVVKLGFLLFSELGVQLTILCYANLIIALFTSSSYCFTIKLLNSSIFTLGERWSTIAVSKHMTYVVLMKTLFSSVLLWTDDVKLYI